MYGTVLAMASLAAGALAHLGPDELIEVVAAASGVIWLAHVYAHTLGESLERGHRIDLAEFKSIAAKELPILIAAAAPISVLLLGVFGVVKEGTSIWLAFGLGFGVLAAHGAQYARAQRLGAAGMTVVIALNLALGGLVVALKVLVSHH